MNKKELVTLVAMTSCISNAQAEKAINAMIDAVTVTLANGGTVPLHGLGTFSVAKHNARTGRNPKTGQPISIPAKKVPKLSPSESLRRLINE